MHIAANFGYRDVAEIFQKKAPFTNVVDKLNRKPIEMSTSKDAINLLASTEELIQSVRRNMSSEVEKFIKSGAIVDARNIDGRTSLHYAAWKGYEGIVKLLLQNKANPSVDGSKNSTPSHYAAKFLHLKIVKVLLSYGAVYNDVSDSGKTPSDLCADKDIASLFNLISESFKKVKEYDVEVIHDLSKINDIVTVKAIMIVCNRENQTIVATAIQNSFPEVH